MVGRLLGAAFVLVALVGALQFAVSIDAGPFGQQETTLFASDVILGPDSQVLGIQAFRNSDRPTSYFGRPGRAYFEDHRWFTRRRNLTLSPWLLRPTKPNGPYVTSSPQTTVGVIAAPAATTTTASPVFATTAVTIAATTTTREVVTATTRAGATTTTRAAVTTTTRAPVTTTTRAPAPTTTVAPTTTIPASTVGAPAGSIVIAAGSNIQSVVNSKPAGSTFYLQAGVYRQQSIKPRTGDVFIGQSGAILNGEDSTAHAFTGNANNVTIRNLVIENYRNPAQSGAINGTGSGWTITGNEVRNNWGGGVLVKDRFVVVNNNIHHNRQIGIKGGGAGILIEGNEIAFNNHRNDYEMNWEAGGTKFLKTSDLVVRGNYVHDNHGHGLWTDHDNVGTVYENNTVINNHGSGIFHEISGRAVIRNNRVEGNAFQHSHGGIKVANSDNVEVYGNTVVGNNGGIHAGQNDRGGIELANLWVHDNVISFTSGWSGVIVNDGLGDVYFTGRNNRFDRNSYNLGNDQAPFRWLGGQVSREAWRGFGLDVNGTIG